MNLQEHLLRQRSWSLETFGPGDRTAGIIDHLINEIVEVEQCRGQDVEEWIDIVILALDGAWRAGYTPGQICEALRTKQLKNEQREWPSWRKAEPGKAIEHVRK